jgi:hypothetical protein
MEEQINEIRTFVKSEAERFGAINKNNSDEFYIERNNTKTSGREDDGEYFGIISPNENPTGPYHDFSLVIFPSDKSTWVISLGIGSQGFKDDFELATIPGVRRVFSRLVTDMGFYKTDFSDIETSLPKAFLGKVIHLKNTLGKYKKVLPVCEIIDIGTANSKDKISAFVASYAKLRNWPSNRAQRVAVEEAINKVSARLSIDDEEEALRLLEKRKYIIIEGPAGTGKTRLAKRLCKRIDGFHYLTQFHSSVSYSDFVEGIKPDLEGERLLYKHHGGIFLQAIWDARSSERNVVLIIDEINRADLSNVFGPLFYLLEYKRERDSFFFRLPNGDILEDIPNNLYIIGTMNTSDRSLAIVDFALRRRFGWYNLKPKAVDDKKFYLKDFNFFDSTFKWFANSSELNYQPGQAYFFADNDNEMQSRIKYELLPLIKEYLAEGIMINAKEEFNEYFKNRISEELFE